MLTWFVKCIRNGFSYISTYFELIVKHGIIAVGHLLKRILVTIGHHLKTNRAKPLIRKES